MSDENVRLCRTLGQSFLKTSALVRSNANRVRPDNSQFPKWDQTAYQLECFATAYNDAANTLEALRAAGVE